MERTVGNRAAGRQTGTAAPAIARKPFHGMDFPSWPDPAAGRGGGKKRSPAPRGGRSPESPPRPTGGEPAKKAMGARSADR